MKIHSIRSNLKHQPACQKESIRLQVMKGLAHIEWDFGFASSKLQPCSYHRQGRLCFNEIFPVRLAIFGLQNHHYHDSFREPPRGTRDISGSFLTARHEWHEFSQAPARYGHLAEISWSSWRGWRVEISNHDLHLSPLLIITYGLNSPSAGSLTDLRSLPCHSFLLSPHSISLYQLKNFPNGFLVSVIQSRANKQQQDH